MYSLPRASLCWSRLRGSLDTFRWSIPRHDWGCQLGNHSAQYQATRQVRSFVSTSSSSSAPTNGRPRWILYASTLLVVGGSGLAAYETNEPFRHTCLAAIRCSRVAKAVVISAADYKLTFAKSYKSQEEESSATSECHTRSAKRVLHALLANGGIFIKLGQHMSSLVVLPREWTSTMRPLQDQCYPTPMEDIEKLFIKDVGHPLSELFDEFNPEPLGVASLAQVHSARDKETGKRVAVKLQHPHLQEFCDVDMKMVEVSLAWVKSWFPSFEFTWLGEEMRENLPKEMDFVHEAKNTERTVKEFANVRSSLYIPQVLSASKRVLIMEFIEGGRVDDLNYLADHNIDRNKVALELQRIFCRMVHLNGWFHADPHLGNLLIRPAPPKTASPYNFEVVLLDHGLYFDIDNDLRINYSKLWLSFMSPASPETNAERRKYAELVGNIGPDLYPVFETAITGRAGMEGAWDDMDDDSSSPRRSSSLIDLMPQTEEEMEAIRNAVIEREGLLLSVFDLLRRVPRRLLMLLKLNDLTRSLDRSLATTHSSVRIFLITAAYCTKAVWKDTQRKLIDDMKKNGILSTMWRYFGEWWKYHRSYQSIRFFERYLDMKACVAIARAWVYGLITRGPGGAHLAAAGLVI